MFFDSRVLDNGLSVIPAEATHVRVLGSYTVGDPYAAVEVNTIGSRPLVAADWGVIDSDPTYPGSRRVTFKGKEVPLTSNTPTTPNLVAAWTDNVNARVLWVTDVTNDRELRVNDRVQVPAAFAVLRQPVSV